MADVEDEANLDSLQHFAYWGVAGDYEQLAFEVEVGKNACSFAPAGAQRIPQMAYFSEIFWRARRQTSKNIRLC